MKWIGQHIYDLVSRFRSDVFIENSDLTIYKPINDDPAIINLGSSATERLEIKANYASGTQEVNNATFKTYTESTTGNRGRFVFSVDETVVLQMMDAGLNLTENKALQIDGTDIISDSSGTATLSNIDAIDGTTTTTLNAALNFPLSASIIREGIVELATTAETTTGTDADRAVTPDGLKDGYLGSANVTTLGTIGTGTWRGTAIAHAYIGTDAIETDNIADAQVTVAKLHADAIQTSGESFADNDTSLMTSAAIDDHINKKSIRTYGDTIKLLFSDFLGNEDGGATKAAPIFDDDGGNIGVKPGSSSTMLYAITDIPEGKKATHVHVYGNNTRTVDVYELNVNASTGSSLPTTKGTGSVGTELDFTDVNSTATNFLVVRVSTAATSDRIYGALITTADI
jgi:hypothetical protein